MSSHVFREYDIRGRADRDLKNDLVHRIGRALAETFHQRGKPAPRINVARDCRASSPRLFEALVSGLVESGAEVIDVGTGPTPLLYFSVHHLESDGGIMITGSHNAAPDNGFKIMRGKSSFFGSDLQQLRERVEAGEFRHRQRGSIQTMPLEEEYVHHLRDSVTLEDSDVRVVVDAGNGAAGPAGLKALRSVGLDPVALFCDMDGSFPNHHPDPTVLENLETLIETVRARDALVGIAWDGDGDRLGVVDRDGTPVFGDRLLALFARDLLRTRPGAAVIGEVKCSEGLFSDIERHGGRPILWKTGHSLIKTKMREEKALLAGEMSGHFFFADRYFGFDDGIYAALRLIEILAREGKSVGELLSDLPRGVSTPEIRLDCPDDVKFGVVDRVRERLREEGDLTDIDGVRVRYDDGAWALVRASNTGPVIVLRFEAPTEARLDEVRNRIERVVDQARAELEA